MITSLIIYPVALLVTFIVFNYFIDDRLNLKLPDGNRDVPIDGVRGFLALSVMTHHYYIFYVYLQNGIWVAPELNFMRNIGHFSVYIFFMITGYLFVGRLTQYKLEGKKPSWVNIYKSRLFRILPLYFFVILISYMVNLYDHGFTLNVSKMGLIKEIVKWIYFSGWKINGDPDGSLIHAAVTWTLKYEWLFYISLPVIFFLLKSSKAIFLFVLMLIYIYIFPIDAHILNTRYLLLFALGALCGYYKDKIDVKRFKITGKVAGFLTLSLCVAALLLDETGINLFVVISATLLFFILSSGNDIFGILSSRCSRLLGEISYSIYLIHGIVIFIIFKEIIGDNLKLSPAAYFMLMPLVMVIVCLISGVLFKYVESPFINLGKRLRFNNSSKILMPVDKTQR